ncbi:MAG: hypothetical protein AB7O96_05270 [Pseudobdellovibrionaceae bacterium]
MAIEREMFEGSLKVEVLKGLGSSAHQAWRSAYKFRDHNVESLDRLYKEQDNQAVVFTNAKQTREDLEKMIAEDLEIHEAQRDGWV